MGEKKQIRISVKDKIACLVDKEQFLVCGNNDYEVVFDFDSDWEGISAKTAVFVYGNTPVHKPFVGNVCEGIEIKNATLCAIGVFAGDIKTTTGATIECRQSIRDIGGVPKPPTKEVYDEIMALLDKAIEAHTELPVGGKAGQVLKKVSDKDYDTEWANDEQRDLTEIDKKIESLDTAVKQNAESLTNKLDKTTEANKIYGTDSEGNQATLPVDTFAKRKAHNPNFYTALGYGATPEETTFIMSGAATPNSIVYRDGSGNFKVNTPTDDSHPAPKGYVVAQTTTPSRLYGTNANGAQTLHQFSQSVIPWFISARGERGELFVPYTPYTDAEATSKKYVDGLVNPISEKQIAIEERVSDLENLTLSYHEITSTDYEKAVPAEVGKYALVKMIGGATEKVISKNIINPNNIAGHFIYPGSSETIVAPHTVNADGSISVTMDIKIGEYLDLFTNFGLSAGKYYYLVVGADVTNFTYALNITVYYRNSDNGTATVKIMAYKYEDSDTVEFTEAPEGTVFEPYHEPYFVNAEVERIESIGANRFNQTLLNEYSDYFSVDEIGVTLKKSDGRAWANIPTSYTLEAGDYTIHAEKSDTCRIQVYSVEAERVIKETSKGIVTFTLSEKTSVKIKILAASGTSYPAFIGNVMLSNGTTKVPYKPYSAEPIDSITLPVEAIKARVDGFGLGENYIQVTDNKFEFVQKKKKIILNSKVGTWETYVNQTSNGAYVYYRRISDKKVGLETSDCCPFENKSNSWVNGFAGQYSDHPTLTSVYFCTDLATLAEFKSWLDAKEASGNPVELEYELATPVVTDITDLFTDDNKLQVQQGGAIRFVNERKMAIPNTIAFIKRKE